MQHSKSSAKGGNGPQQGWMDRIQPLVSKFVEEYGPALAELLLKKLVDAVQSKGMAQHANDVLKAALDQGGNQPAANYGLSDSQGADDADQE